jgi:hypothetical protein
MAKPDLCIDNKPNENFTPLPIKPTDDLTSGSLKINLPSSPKYGKGK